MTSFKAVIFDFGGVITSSPFQAFNRMEAQKGLPRDIVRQINARNPDDNAWAKFERDEIDAEGFDAAFAAEAALLGHDIAGRDVIACLAGDVRTPMVRALDWLKANGYRLGCITNNVRAGHGAGMAFDEGRAAAASDALDRFEHIIESSKAGVRKPDPRIYTMMCEALQLAPTECVYLDDLGINCKPAAMLGMHAIKVSGQDQALADLAKALTLPEDWPALMRQQ